MRYLLSFGLLVMASSACGADEPEVSTGTASVASDQSSTTEGADTSGAEEVEELEAADDSSTTTSTAKAPAGPAVLVEEVGLSVSGDSEGDRYGSAGAVLKNSGDTSAVFFEVVFTFKDASGVAVGTETTYVPAIDPGGIGHAVVDYVSLQADATSVEVFAVVDDSDFSIWTGTVIPVEVTGLVVEFGSQGVQGTATNPASTVLESAQVTCVLRSGGAITGGLTTYLDTMVPGAQVAWKGFSMIDGLQADTAECSAGIYE